MRLQIRTWRKSISCLLFKHALVATFFVKVAKLFKLCSQFWTNSRERYAFYWIKTIPKLHVGMESWTIYTFTVSIIFYFITPMKLHH